MYFKYFSFLFLFLIANLSQGQQIHQSRGLMIFNQGEYRVAIDSLMQFAEKSSSEKGIAYYFIGECYYNLGLDTPNPSQALNFYREAGHYFELAIRETDLGTIYQDKFNEAKYKWAWSTFRQAELVSNPMIHLKQVIQILSELSSTPADTIGDYSDYLIGESYFQIASWLRVKMLLSMNEGEVIQLAKDGLGALENAKRIFNRLIRSSTSPNYLIGFARFRLQDVYLEKGRYFQKMTHQTFLEVRDVEKQETPELTALKKFQNVNYKSVLSGLDRFTKDLLSPTVIYNQTFTALNSYLIMGDEKDKQTFNSLLDSLTWTNFNQDKIFFQATRDYRSGLEQETFTLLTDKNRSRYLEVSKQIPEAWYWLGWAQFVANEPSSFYSFGQFLENSQRSAKEPRIEILREDARYRQFLLQFDRHAAERSVLKDLKEQIIGFQPRNQKIQIQKELLLQLIRVGLGEPIWTEVLKARTTEEKLNNAFVIVRSMLVRATRVTGKERVPYLRYLEKLFEITEDRRSQETTFYRGLLLFLKAEIQETTEKKRKFYMDAANTLANSRGQYRSEGLYVQARSFFAAAKHESSEGKRNEVYTKAKPMFIQLINDAKSLRSVYYLAEIFRNQGNDLAAQRCYEVVIQKTKNNLSGSFWYNNALAGIQSCVPVGDVTVLNNIEIANVQFPEKLLIVNNEEISLERFADPDYVRKQYWEQGIELLIKFGLPLKSLYPSKVRINNSLFNPYTFQSVTLGIDEPLRMIFAGLRLQVVLPSQVNAQTLVTLDDLPLNKNSQGFYEKIPISLNQEIEIKVLNNQCYPFIHNHRFQKLGIEELTVSLNRHAEFIHAGTKMEPGIELLTFPQRFDKNVLVQPMTAPLSPASFLYKHLQSEIRYRDFGYSKLLNAYLVVEDGNENLIVYRNDAMVSKQGEFPLTYPQNVKPIKKPEGITIDSKGNIYIVDWGNHRICIFNKEGLFARQFGTFGENLNSDVGQPIHLVFPTRITLVEDYEGVNLNGQQLFRSPLIFVTDRNGIQVMSHEGIYWDTVTPPSMEKGSLYSVIVRGYGENLRLYVVNRVSGKLDRFTAHFQ